MDDEESYLYHVTTAGLFDSIADGGLQAGGGGRFGAGYAGYARGKLFLTEPEGVYFWHHRVGQSEGPIESAEEVPVVLRFIPTEEESEALEEDEIGTRDAGGRQSYYLPGGHIDPERLEVWNGEEWLEATDTEEGEILGLVEESGEQEFEDEEDEEGWMEFDDMVLFPPELHP